MALSTDGLPRISYSHYFTEDPSPNYDLRYGWFEGLEWKVETADGEGLDGWFTSLTIDSDDHPCISY